MFQTKVFAYSTPLPTTSASEESPEICFRSHCPPRFTPSQMKNTGRQGMVRSQAWRNSSRWLAMKRDTCSCSSAERSAAPWWSSSSALNSVVSIRFERCSIVSPGGSPRWLQ